MLSTSLNKTFFSLCVRCESGKYAVFFVYQMRVWKVYCVLCLSDASLESTLCSLFIRCDSGKYAVLFVYQMRVWKVCRVLPASLGADCCKGCEGVEAVEDGGAVHVATPPLPPLPAHQHPGALPQRHLPGTVTPLTTHTRHPYHHSQPISIPVHFLNDTYQVQLHL